MPCLATLDELRRHLGLRADETDDDPRLLAAIDAASADLERDCGRRFEPRFAVIGHTLEAADDALSLSDDLLVLTALTDEHGPIPLDTVNRVPAQGPAALLRLTGGRSFAGEVEASGWWGWHDDPAAMWTPTGMATADDPLHADSALVTVTDASAFSPAHLLRIEAELVRVQSVDTALHQLTVLRAQQGTDAASHAQGAAIDAYAPPPNVRDHVLRRAAWLARRSEPLPDSLRTPALRWRRDRV